MTYFLFILKSAFFDFSRNKGRTVLTSLGILIGVLSVILLIAFGLGLKKYIDQQFESLAPNLLRVVPGQILQGGGFRGGASSFGVGVRFDEKDINSLKRIREMEYVVPAFTKTIEVVAGSKSELTDLYSSSAEMFNALNVKPQYGSLFTKSDVDKRLKIAVLGPKIAEKLFSNRESAIDRKIKIEGQTFKVIGVTESKGGGGFGGPDFDSYVYIPYKTGYMFNPDKKFFAIITKVKNNINLDFAKSKIEEVMKKRYEEEEFSVIKQTDLLNAISSIFNVINVVLVAIAAISLIVGGIGIMNIMYVTVTERIKEIGIRRAMGARRSDILYQFLIESVLLSLFGGLLAVVIAYFIVLFIQQFFPAYINLESILLALGVSSAIGIIFGVFPAKKAADLSPIDAIRYE
ncbi:ABC transporter permease [Candidatus Roizmanbacteria bacterium]|nr:ABC transporter permease [Candidatus Roizmanbacteria bacterium]